MYANVYRVMHEKRDTNDLGSDSNRARGLCRTKTISKRFDSKRVRLCRLIRGRRVKLFVAREQIKTCITKYFHFSDVLQNRNRSEIFVSVRRTIRL